MADERASRFAGYTMIAGALATLLVLSHHPAIKARTGRDVFTAIGGVSTTDNVVHGAVIAFTLALVFALCVLTLRLRERPVSVGALICYAFGAASWVGAALLDGFFIPMIGARYATAPASALSSGLALVQFCAIGIQVFTKFGVIVTNAAILLWSVALVRMGDALVVSAVGFAAVVIEACVLLFSGPYITAHTVVLVVAPMALWYLATGVWMVRDHRASI